MAWGKDPGNEVDACAEPYYPGTHGCYAVPLLFTRAVAVAGSICMSFERARSTVTVHSTGDMLRGHQEAVSRGSDKFLNVTSPYLRKSDIAGIKFCPGVWGFGRLYIACTKWMR